MTDTDTGMGSAGGTESLIRVLDAAESAPGPVRLRARGYELLQVKRGVRVIDVGCGTGRAVAELADRGAQACGIDRDPVMVAAARRRFPQLDVRVGDATVLPLGDGQALGYRADKLLHDVPDPQAVLDEARRVLAPGGRIVLAGQDWDTVVIESSQAELTRRIVHARADAVAHPRVARSYRNLLRGSGFAEVELEAHTGVFTGRAMLPMLAGYANVARESETISDEQVRDWLGEQKQRADDDRLLIAIPMFLASATR